MFLWDSGSSVGEITGHSKFINSIDYRPVRPFRVVTAGEDKSVGWFEGPPFRFKNSFKVRGWSSQATGRRESEGKGSSVEEGRAGQGRAGQGRAGLGLHIQCQM